MRIARLGLIFALLMATFLALSCASTQEVVLDDEELNVLANKKLEMSRASGLIKALARSKKRKQAVELLNQLLDSYPESSHAKEAQMTLADLWFDDEKYEEAEAEYTAFLRFYPSSAEAEKAQFRLLLTHERRIGTFDRDQSSTHKTLDVCGEYGKRHPGGEFTANVAAIERESDAMLAEHEFYVGRLYYRRHEYAAATTRLEGVLRDFPDTEAACKALFYLAKLDVKLERQADAIEKLQRLVQDYPGCHSTDKAKRLLEALKQ
ncbi:MAG: outer membrane protein assembly factor BamD [Candidatus Coatesbacteria bacterium]|nr:outer membrane protein assembly factor BamD [Candidatus Coatesbacteria bacterium]